jgi:3-oxoacyl-[acyl-carrier-protein] synthase-3
MPERIRAAMIGTGSAVPSKVLTNQDLEQMVDTTDEWIVQRTGIRERHILGEGESTATLAATAARNAIENAGLQPDDIDLIVCGTVSSEMPFPATACFVQEALGISTDAPAFDVSAACSGFLYSLSVGTQFIESGKYKRVLVLGADCLSSVTDWTDRGSCILFGDAAGAAVLEATTEDKGVQYTVMKTLGSGWDFIHVPGGGTRHPVSHETVDAGLQFVKMRGRDVYKFAVDKMQWLLGDCMNHCGLSVDDVDMVVPHQVNTRIIDSATKKFNFPIEKVYLNIDRFGNTSAASIPLALDQARREGKISTGDTVLFVAFGAGLTWAGAVVRM